MRRSVPVSPPADGPVRLSGDLIRRIRVVAELRGLTMKHYVESLITKPVDRDYRDVLAQETDALQGVTSDC